MTNEQLQHWLFRFVLEVRRMNGQLYPPDTVHHIIFDIMKHLHQQGKQLDIFWDMCFLSPEQSLIPKWSSWKLQVLLPRAVKQSHFLHRKKINCGALVSWETTVLGYSLTQFYSKMDWILLCRVEASTEDWGSTTARFKLSNEKESVLSSVTLKIPPRTTKEELKNRKSGPKTAIQYDNLDNPQLCPVCIFKKYTQCVHQTIQNASSIFNHCQNPSKHVGI